MIENRKIEIIQNIFSKKKINAQTFSEKLTCVACQERDRDFVKEAVRHGVCSGYACISCSSERHVEIVAVCEVTHLADSYNPI